MSKDYLNYQNQTVVLKLLMAPGGERIMEYTLLSAETTIPSSGTHTQMFCSLRE